MTVPAAALSSTDDPQPALAGELLALASGEDFTRLEQQLAATGNCASPLRLHGRIDAIDRATRPARRSTKAMPGRSSGPG